MEPVSSMYWFSEPCHRYHLKLRGVELHVPARLLSQRSVISPIFPVLMDLREPMGHLWFPKYPERSSGLKEIRISSILVLFVSNCACVSLNDWLIY